MPKRLGIIPHLYAQPLFEGLRGAVNAKEIDVELVEDVPARLAIQLREEKLHGAFLSPIDYAKENTNYKILPNLGVSSEGESGTAYLIFKEHLNRIRSVAVDPGYSSEIVLAHIILAEKYDTPPQFVPMKSTVEESLSKADALLVVSTSSQSQYAASSKLDLVDEWMDLTGLPYVHGFWVSREGALSPHETQVIARQSASASTLEGELLSHASYLLNFQYDLNENALAGLAEFFRMAYYYGILKDIPDVKMMKEKAERHSSTN